MSKNLRNCLGNMKIVCDTKCAKLQKSFLKEMSKRDDFFKALFEIVHNISLKKLKLKPSDKRKLKRHLKIMNKIIAKPKSKVKRSKIINQSGGFITAILPLVVTAVSELISYAISKKSGSHSS